MNITFHGAARTVTGSKHLVELKRGTRILLDCGMFQGNPREADALNRDWGFNPEQIDYVILSHAHIDHCGLIPRLIKEGYKGRIYCTGVTFDMVKILLMDSAYIHESDVRYHNKKRAKRHEEAVEALYTVQDAEHCFSRFDIVEYHEVKKLDDDIEFMFTDAGHIIGSAAVHLKITEGGKDTRITFSGDVGRYNDKLLPSPETFPQADYLLLESTYGSSLHEEIHFTENKLLEIITHTCLKKRGKLIIPSFSVGRTQEIVYALNRLDIAHSLPDIDFFVDSPLSVEATQIMKDHMDVLNKDFQADRKKDSTPFDFKRLHYIENVEESKALNTRSEPCVIISASGMADAGRVKHHIKNSIEDKRNTILLMGYCEPNSLGGKLMRGYKEVTIFGEHFMVSADIEMLNGMSAHGDYDDLCQFIACQNPAQVKKLFLVHGEYDVQQTFEGKLRRKGFAEVEIPTQHQTVELG
jgi:metallo-beta-lactamase family protein